ncbi:MAG: TonB family protein [Phenylobacterium sp.]|uniref:TonB family protein n=1 Tax=Phenylobacterium sp. TaxID=1871053 RepID=UPI001A400085|nr:TonB family protein [Phenylobacterium sp.]MBL8771962.1 TonB family protein [Phenylobacterium sp.]
MAVGLAAFVAIFVQPGHGLAADRKPWSEANWVSRPSKDEEDAAFKTVATDGLRRAVIKCAVADDGALLDCKVERETPANSGVGAAALSLASKYRRVPPGAKGAREVRVVMGTSDFDKAPDWLRRPTPDQLLAVFPTEAYRRGQSGKAAISCVISVQGTLTDCVTVEESPVGAGFGGAAIALTPQFLMRPAMRAGKPVPSGVNIPIHFITGGPGETFGTKRVIDAAIAWTQAPSYEEVAAAYPAKARAERKGGRATVGCDMTDEGRLARCNVLTSEPRGYGFDIAAKSLAKSFMMEVRSDADRKAARGLEFHVPIVFDPGMLDPATRVVGKPSWAALPKGDQLMEAFKDVETTGSSRATLSCAVGSGGVLTDCSVLQETPAGAGVGAAALKLVPMFRMTTWTAEGLPVVGGRVNIPIRYEPAGKTADKGS